MEKYDVFISYRRIGGEATARILCDRLQDAGYRVFFDVDTLRSGDFNQKLYDVIAGCKDFIIVLSPDSLDRCEQEGDWVRNELSFALKQKKNVIPILLKGFHFPDNLPADIEAVRVQNGLEASTEFFDAFMEKLYTFLKSKKPLFGRVVQNRAVRKAVPLFLALALVSLCIIGGFAIYHQVQNRAFPSTQEEKNIVGELLGDMGSSLAGYNNVISLERNSLQAASDSILAQDSVVQQNVLSDIDQSISSISQINPAITDISAVLSSKLDKTVLDKASVRQLMDAYALYAKEAADNLRFIKYIVRDSIFSTDVKKKIVDLYLLYNDYNANAAVYLTNEVILPIQASSLTDFKRSLTYCTSLPFEGYEWVNDDETLNNLIASNLNKMDAFSNQLATLTGEQNVLYANDVEMFRSALTDMGYSESFIDDQLRQTISTSSDQVALKERIQAKQEELEQKKKELADIQEMLDAKKQDLRAKYVPSESDEVGTLWGKMMRFLLVDMPDEAITCLDMYAKNAPADDIYAAAYTAAAKDFIRCIPQTGIDYGAIVCGFEGNMPTHPTYAIGDIIVAINGQRCLNADVFYSSKLAEGTMLTVLRFTDGKPNLADIAYHAATYRVAYNAMSERTDADATLPYAGLDAKGLWARMCESAGAFETQEAIDCLQLYHMKVRGSDANADIYVPALRLFYKNVKITGRNYGALVTKVPSKTVDGFRVGDVIVAVNWVPCASAEDFLAMQISAGSMATVLRVASGEMETVDVPMDVQPDITLQNIVSQAASE